MQGLSSALWRRSEARSCKIAGAQGGLSRLAHDGFVGGVVVGVGLHELGEVAPLGAQALEEEGDGVREAELPAQLLRPAQCPKLLAADRIASVVVRTVGHVLHELALAGFQAHQEQEVSGYIHDALLVPSPYVVGLADHTAVHDRVEGAGGVLHVQEVPGVAAAAVDRKLAAQPELRYELRHDLLIELVRPVHIVPSRDDDWKTERLLEALRQEVRPSLRRRIWVVWPQSRRLNESHPVVEAAFAVHLVGAAVDESADADFSRSLQHRGSALHVVARELSWAALLEGQVYVRLRR
mmetsp:Transcript_16690/g.33984  ORF Transcript_16690/g.33984 Transcript_16690/m.33984 type:complete len:295 (+) Transcript_16690:128-1012(+)